MASPVAAAKEEHMAGDGGRSSDSVSSEAANADPVIEEEEEEQMAGDGVQSSDSLSSEVATADPVTEEEEEEEEIRMVINAEAVGNLFELLCERQCCTELPDVVKLDLLLRDLEDFKIRHPMEYDELGVSAVAVTITHPYLVPLCNQWSPQNPLQSPLRGFMSFLLTLLTQSDYNALVTNLFPRLLVKLSGQATRSLELPHFYHEWSPLLTEPLRKRLLGLIKGI